MAILPNVLPPDAQGVVQAYPSFIAEARWTGVSAGFSGARLWHGVAARGAEFALKAHSPKRIAATALTTIHRWMDMLQRPEIPVVQRTKGGTTVVEQGSVWEVLTWVPGVADFHAHPTSTRLFATVSLLGAMHRQLAKMRTRLRQPIPAILRRLQALETWQRLFAQGWQPGVLSDDSLRPLVNRAWFLMPTLVFRSVQQLQTWRDREAYLQPCLCDVWHDNVLYTGEQVTGIIDYAAMKYDHPAQDIARLLGSLLPVGHSAYEAARRQFHRETDLDHPELVPLLEATGDVVAVTHWLRWLYDEQRSLPNRNALAGRLEWLVARLEATI